MQELGEDAVFLHADLGFAAAAAGLDHLVLIGESPLLESLLDSYKQALGKGGLLLPSIEAAQGYFDQAREGDCVLVKGSRSSHLEDLIKGRLS